MVPAVMQLAAQAICLEEMFSVPVMRGAVWLHGQRRRRDINITENLRVRSLGVAAAIRGRRSVAALPPAVADGRCPDCSLINECLPALVVDPRRALALHCGLFDPGPAAVTASKAVTRGVVGNKSTGVTFSVGATAP